MRNLKNAAVNGYFSGLTGLIYNCLKVYKYL